MSFLKTALFYMVGSAIGGPIGGLLAAIIGSHVTGGRGRTQRGFSSNEQQQTAFFAALFACLAKLAKADGHISEEEIEKAKQEAEAHSEEDKKRAEAVSYTHLRAHET